MMLAQWTGATAFIMYVVATLIAVRQLSGRTAPRRSLFLVLGGVAVLFQACSLWQVTVTDQGVLLGLFPVASLIAATGAALTSLTSLYRPLEWVSVMAYPVAALTIPATLYIHTGYRPNPLPHGLGAHVLLSIIAYAVLAVAAAQATLLMVQHRQLKEGHIRGIMSRMPPVQTMETMLFELIWTGEILLTVGIITGFIYVQNLLAQHLAGKTAITLFAWVVFAILLSGRHFMGWRGVKAVRWTLTGFVLLLIAFFGSQLVQEILINPQ